MIVTRVGIKQSCCVHIREFIKQEYQYSEGLFDMRCDQIYGNYQPGTYTIILGVNFCLHFLL